MQHVIRHREITRTVTILAPVPVGAVLVKVQRGPDAELLRLGRQLERCLAHERWLNSPEEMEKPNAELWHERAFAASLKVVKTIGALHAHTVEGLAVKARAFAWWHYAGPDIPTYSNDDPAEVLAHQIITGLTQA